MEMLLGLTATGCRENWPGEKCRRGSKYLASQVLITGHQACKVRRAINPSPVPQPLQQSIVLKTFTQHGIPIRIRIRNRIWIWMQINEISCHLLCIVLWAWYEFDALALLEICLDPTTRLVLNWTEMNSVRILFQQLKRYRRVECS